MSFPSIADVRAASVWFLLRYTAAAGVVDVLLFDMTDAYALAAIISSALSVRVDVWSIDSFEVVLLKEVNY